MAARFSLCPSSPVIFKISPKHHSPATKGVRGPRFVVMSADDKYHLSVDLQIRSSFKNQAVFEDSMAGIVCYRDENGEITCEGYDEGPRLHHQFSIFGFNNPKREVGIIEILERCWLHQVQVGDGINDELNNADK